MEDLGGGPPLQGIFENVDNTAFMVPNSRLDGALIPFLGTVTRTFGALEPGAHGGPKEFTAAEMTYVCISPESFFQGDSFASGTTRIGDHFIIRSFGL